MYFQVRRATSLCIEKDERKREVVETLKKVELEQCFAVQEAPRAHVQAPTPATEDPCLPSQPKDTSASHVLDTESDPDTDPHSDPEPDPLIEAQLAKSKARYSLEVASKLAVEAERRRIQEERGPRSGGVIKVTFHQRQFKNPARESKREEEEEWLRKQVRRRSGECDAFPQALARATKTQLEDEDGLDYEEVVRKSGKFFQAGDFGSAEEVILFFFLLLFTQPIFSLVLHSTAAPIHALHLLLFLLLHLLSQVLHCGLRLFPRNPSLYSRRATVSITYPPARPSLLLTGQAEGRGPPGSSGGL